MGDFITSENAMLRTELRRLEEDRDESRAEIAAAWEALGGDLTGDLPEAIRQLHGHLAKAREGRDAALARAEKADADWNEMRSEMVVSRLFIREVATELGRSTWDYEQRRELLGRVERWLASGEVGPSPLDAALARVAALEAVLAKVETWAHVYGAALSPAAGVADTHGEGVRACKAQVLDILCHRAGAPTPRPAIRGMGAWETQAIARLRPDGEVAALVERDGYAAWLVRVPHVPDDDAYLEVSRALDEADRRLAAGVGGRAPTPRPALTRAEVEAALARPAAARRAWVAALDAIVKAAGITTYEEDRQLTADLVCAVLGIEEAP